MDPAQQLQGALSHLNDKNNNSETREQLLKQLEEHVSQLRDSEDDLLLAASYLLNGETGILRLCKTLVSGAAAAAAKPGQPLYFEPLSIAQRAQQAVMGCTTAAIVFHVVVSFDCSCSGCVMRIRAPAAQTRITPGFGSTRTSGWWHSWRRCRRTGRSAMQRARCRRSSTCCGRRTAVGPGSLCYRPSRSCWPGVHHLSTPVKSTRLNLCQHEWYMSFPWGRQGIAVPAIGTIRV